MKGFFLQDMKRSFLNRGFFAGLMAVTAIFISAAMRSPLGRTRSSYYIMAQIFAASGFTPFAAVFPGLAYATNFCEEYSSGYWRMIFSRVSVKKFGWIRIVTVAFSGGVMMAIPFILAMSIIYLCGIPGVPSGSDEGFMAGTTLIYYIKNYGEWYIFVAKIVLGFLFGCLWALVGLAFAVWIPNKYVALITPFVVYEAMWLVLGKIPVLNPIYLVRGDDLNSYPLSMLMQCVYIILVSVMIIYGLKRRYQDG